MRHHRFQRRSAWIRGMFQPQFFLLASLLIFFAAPQMGLAQCSEKPTVWMSEHTAASHLLASRKIVFPAEAPVLVQIRKVVVTVTVNRRGAICQAKASAGPKELWQAAEQNVKSFWRYRPFLLDGKAVVVQFPVTVHFVLSADKRSAKVSEIAGIRPQNLILFLQADTGTPRI